MASMFEHTAGSTGEGEPCGDVDSGPCEFT